MATETFDTGERSPEFNGTHAYQVGVAEETVLEVLNADYPQKRRLLPSTWDFSSFLQNGTLRLYYDLLGAGYVVILSQPIVAGTIVILNVSPYVRQDFKITYQAALAEAGIIDLPWEVAFQDLS